MTVVHRETPAVVQRRGARSAVPRLLAVLATAALALAAGVAAAPAASAHDTLVSTNPADGATVASVPDAVVLTFDQPALGIGSVVQVTGPSGDVEQGSPRLVDDDVTQPLAPGAPAGAYRIAWRVTSADGHPVTGELTFTATAANGRTPSATQTTPTSPYGDLPDSAPSSFPVVGLVVVVLILILGVVLILAASGKLPRRRSRRTATDEDDD